MPVVAPSVPASTVAAIGQRQQASGLGATKVVSGKNKKKKKASAQQREQVCRPEVCPESKQKKLGIAGPGGSVQVHNSEAGSSREDRWQLLKRMHDEKQQRDGSCDADAEARGAAIGCSSGDVECGAAEGGAPPLLADEAGNESSPQPSQAKPRQAKPSQDPAPTSSEAKPQQAPRKLDGARADSLAFFTTKLNETAVLSHLRTAGTQRAVLATPIDPCDRTCSGVLQVQLGAVVLCEAVDAFGWCFGTVLAPKSLAGQRGCFRRDRMHPVAAEIHRHSGGDRMELSTATWGELDRARGGSTQDRLRQKALLNRMTAARKAWDAQAALAGSA